MTPQEALKAAFEEAGGEAKLARSIGVTPQAVNQWDVAPPTRVLAIEEAVNAKITRHQLRPDIFGPDPRKAA
jgi:DNA-binding transcriptional regulator YdaS (Cro superfamily)